MEIKFTVYRTTNLVNGRYYIGVHKTVEPNDGYLGSGKLIKRAIAKYGEGNFHKEVLFAYGTESEAFAKEFELVEAAKSDKLCYNLRQGGSGGFDWINHHNLNGYGRKKAGYALNKAIEKDSTLKLKRQANLEKGFAILQSNRPLYNQNLNRGYKHKWDEQSRAQARRRQQERRWITDGYVVKGLNKNEPIPEGWTLGRIKIKSCEMCATPVKENRRRFCSYRCSRIYQSRLPRSG